MLKTFSLMLTLLALSSPVFAAQMSAPDSDLLANILKSASGEKTANFTRVACRWKRMSPTICTYVHTSGNRDSFAWLKAAKAADILLAYKAETQLDSGLLEVSVQNLNCENGICSFEQ